MFVLYSYSIMIIVLQNYKLITLFFLFYLLQEVCVECSALVENTTTTTTNIPHKRNITESYTATTTATSNKNSNKKNSTECEVSDVDYSDSEEDAEIFHRYRAERSKAADAAAITAAASDNQSAQNKPMYTATVAPTTTIAATITSGSGDGVDVALQVLQQVSLLYILLTLYN